MHLRPPVEMARCRLIAQLHEWINTITGLPRIQSSRYQVRGWEKWRLPWSLYVCDSGILAFLLHVPHLSLFLVLPSLSSLLLPIFSFSSSPSLFLSFPPPFLSPLLPSLPFPPPLFFSSFLSPFFHPPRLAWLR